MKSSDTRISGLSSSILISSRITPRSRSMSGGAKRGFSTRSLSTSRAMGTWSDRDLTLKQMVSLLVKASRLPPMESISRAMCCAVRERVPLKSMCSTKWEMPLVSAGSQREPDLTHTPMATERIYSMRSVRTIRPLGNTVRRSCARWSWSSCEARL